jgi:hypothetical protein
MHNRTFVILNMDEFSLSKPSSRASGLVYSPKVARRASPKRQQARPDRTNTKTTLVAVITNEPGLQPVLPQVVLARYSQHAVPPIWLQHLYHDSSFPFEFWHGTAGGMTVELFMRWCTRIRSVIHSFNNDAWIVLILDCHSVHLDIRSVTHLSRLGIIPVFVPGKLTWLLQALDVYVFAELRANIRRREATERLQAANGLPARGSWVEHVTRAVRSIIVNRDWSAELEKVGAGLEHGALRSAVRDYVGHEPILPALPLRQELGLLLNRRPNLASMHTLHAYLLRYALAVRNFHPLVRPIPGALEVLPEVPVALPHVPFDDAEDAPWDDVVMGYLNAREDEGALPPGLPGARQIVV